MSIELPKLRSDLLFSRQTRDGQTFVVKDPVSQQFFVLQQAEHFLATQLDGQTSPETIRQRVEEKFQVSLSPPSLANFLATLREFDLLESNPSESAARAKRGPLRGSLLYLRLKLFDPDALNTTSTWLMSGS